jgi:hypothetical protein
MDDGGMPSPTVAAGWLLPAVHAAKTALAAALAWAIAVRGPTSQLPVFAPLGALLTMQISVWGSVRRGFQRVAGVVVGVLVASTLGRLWGLHVWSIGLVIFFALLVGNALHLGAQGAVQVPVSALLVLVVGATSTYAEARVVNTLIGAAAGVAVSAVVPSLVNLSEVAAAVARPVSLTAGLLHDLACELEPLTGTVRIAVIEDRTMELLQRARAVAGPLGSAREQVERAVELARWNLGGRVRRIDVERLALLVGALERIDIQTRGIARTLADGTAAGVAIPAPLGRPLAGLVHAAAAAVYGLGTLDLSPSHDPMSAERAADAHYVDLLDNTGGVEGGEGAAAWLLAAAIAVDAQRIVEESVAAAAVIAERNAENRKA